MKKFIPLLILFGLLTLFGRELLYASPTKFSSSMAGETINNFRLNNVLPSQSTFSKKDLIGRVSLLNIWATWCYACTKEAAILMQIKEKYHVPIYGIAYQDDPEEIKTWLKKYGNPYELIGDDRNGDVSLDLGIYGTPETFVISSKGRILYRHIGTLEQKDWEEVIYPLIKQHAKD